jgi:hypothetical protein
MADEREIEAVAEALWRHAGFGWFPHEEIFRAPYYARAVVAIAALDAARLGTPDTLVGEVEHR